MRMEVGSALVAEVLFGAVLFALDAHAYAVLPDVAFFALDHETHVSIFGLC